MKKNIKKKRKKTGLRKLILLIFIIIAIVVFSLITPIFNITKIEVKGNNKVESETIISLSGLSEGENIFRNKKSKIIKKIQENSYIKKVTIKRNLPGTVEIDIQEREVAYQIKLIDGYIYIDNQGYILENSSQKENVPIIDGIETSQDELLNGKRLNKNDLTKLNIVLKIMESAKTIEIENLITSIDIKEPNEYKLYLKKENKCIYLGDGTNLNNKILYIQTMLKEEKKNPGIIFVNGNISEGFKPYFREQVIEEGEKNE